jgi:histone H3/H4
MGRAPTNTKITPADKPAKTPKAPKAAAAAALVAKKAIVHKPAKAAAPAKNNEDKSRNELADVYVLFPRVQARLRKHFKRLGENTDVAVGAFLQYIGVEILELSARRAEQSKRKTIENRDIHMAIQGDEELRYVAGDAVVIGGGVQPFVHVSLWSKGAQKKLAKDRAAKVAAVTEEFEKAKKQITGK